MIIHVASNLQGEIGSREVLRLTNEPAPAMLADDPEITSPINGELTITHEPQGLAVRGVVQASAKLVCDRDLTEFTQQLEAKVDGLYVTERSDEHPDAWVLAGDELDLGPLVRESLMLAVPLHPLCKSDCRVPLAS